MRRETDGDGLAGLGAAFCLDAFSGGSHDVPDSMVVERVAAIDLWALADSVRSHRRVAGAHG